MGFYESLLMSSGDLVVVPICEIQWKLVREREISEELKNEKSQRSDEVR